MINAYFFSSFISSAHKKHLICWRGSSGGDVWWQLDNEDDWPYLSDGIKDNLKRFPPWRHRRRRPLLKCFLLFKCKLPEWIIGLAAKTKNCFHGRKDKFAAHTLFRLESGNSSGGGVEEPKVFIASTSFATILLDAENRTWSDCDLWGGLVASSLPGNMCALFTAF